MSRSIVLFGVLGLLALTTPVSSQCDIQTVVPPTVTGDDEYGASVAVRGDDLLVGAPFNGPSGSARVLRRQGETWQEVQTLLGAGASPGAQFGYAVALFGDLALVSAPSEGGGVVYVFERAGGVWSQTAALVASGNAFGIDVALGSGRALIGAPGSGAHGGKVYVFELSGGVWSETAVLTASDGFFGNKFGSSVALDGTLALIG